MELSVKKDIFIKLNRAVINCSKCRLCKTRINAVPGEGSLNAKLVFVGEAPGAQEDSEGRPFVGRSGMLLNDFLLKIGLSRQQVWIGNVIKCRPPENRDPMVDELRACTPYIQSQLDLIEPKIVATLGRIAMNYFLPNAKISTAHGKPFKYKNKIIFPIYHPAAALRNPNLKEVMYKDFLILKELLNKETKDIKLEGEKVVAEADEISLF